MPGLTAALAVAWRTQDTPANPAGSREARNATVSAGRSSHAQAGQRRGRLEAVEVERRASAAAAGRKVAGLTVPSSSRLSCSSRLQRRRSRPGQRLAADQERAPAGGQALEQAQQLGQAVHEGGGAAEVLGQPVALEHR